MFFFGPGGPYQHVILVVNGLTPFFPSNISATKLYNKCLAKSCFPSCWKSLLEDLTGKNDGDRSDPGKYRPISLLSIVSKIFESFINDSLIKHLVYNDYLSNGVLKGYCQFDSVNYLHLL